MKQKLRTGIIGLGNMGTAILAQNPGFIGFDGERRRRVYAQKHFRITLAGNSQELCRKADIIILAVKPADIDELLNETKRELSGKLIISIAAGMPTAHIEKILGTGSRVIRVMPNIAATVAHSVSAIAPGKNATGADIVNTEKIFKKLGSVIGLAENRIDAFTAVAGSGPAYFFFFMEALIEAAGKAGLGRTQALTIVSEVAEGSIALLRTKMPISTLRERITSKGGTTEAALNVMRERNMQGIISDAIQKAIQRAEELARR
ncbi:MAG: pyrroline-5-carboxylate reductase [Candidatus Omnitrophota bacterium]